MKKFDIFTWVLIAIAFIALIGMMIAFGWPVIFPLAIFISAVYFAAKRIGILGG